MKINNYYWIILVGLFLCIVNCVQAGGNETGLLPGMSKTSFEKILKRTSENIKKKRASADILQFYGNGQYEKITECRGKAVEYQREYGCFVKVGNCRKDGNIYTGMYSFVPRYSARSIPFAENGIDSLCPLFEKYDEYYYVSGNRKIFGFMRALEWWGPLFGDLVNYEFQQLSVNGETLTFQFETRDSCYPHKIPFYCAGTLVLDRKTCELKKIDINQVEYYCCGQRGWKERYLKEVPVDSRAVVEFSYDDKGECFIKSCVLESVWKDVPLEKWPFTHAPSRKEPGKNRLIEKEAFFCETCQRVSKNIQFEDLPPTLMYSVCNLQVEYVSDIFGPLPELLDAKQAFIDLSNDVNIHEQFRQMSNRSYYPEDFFFVLPWCMEADEALKDSFWENSLKINKMILLLFFK